MILAMITSFKHIAIVIELALTYQSKVGGGNDPVYDESGEEDEGSQQGEAEVETACPQARTSHSQNLMSGCGI